MKKQDFLKDVKHEIDMLMEHGTKIELSRLNLDTFAHSHSDNCIYGQMTGTCSSKRAKILMDKACIRVMDLTESIKNNDTFENIQSKINGKNTGQGWRNEGGVGGSIFGSRDYHHLSALEGYIQLKGAKIKNIIKYMKGENKTLKL